jgi:hypothetical protein
MQRVASHFTLNHFHRRAGYKKGLTTDIVATRRATTTARSPRTRSSSGPSVPPILTRIGAHARRTRTRTQLRARIQTQKARAPALNNTKPRLGLATSLSRIGFSRQLLIGTCANSVSRSPDPHTTLQEVDIIASQATHDSSIPV